MEQGTQAGRQHRSHRVSLRFRARNLLIGGWEIVQRIFLRYHGIHETAPLIERGAQAARPASPRASPKVRSPESFFTL